MNPIYAAVAVDLVVAAGLAVAARAASNTVQAAGTDMIQPAHSRMGLGFGWTRRFEDWIAFLKPGLKITGERRRRREAFAYGQGGPLPWTEKSGTRTMTAM
jgi:hypothetical protein